MALNELDIEEIRARISDVWKVEERVLNEQRQIARELKNGVKPLNAEKWRGDAVAYVAADGGDNRIRLDAAAGAAPAIVELVRIVDSEGRECVMETFAGAPEDDSFGKSPPVKKLCEDLECGKIAHLSPYFGDLLDGKILGGEKKSRATSRAAQMREYREIVEWAVFYYLLEESKRDTLLVREGALRTRAFKHRMFGKLDKQIRAAHERRKQNGVTMYYAGVAKQTALLNRLRFALSLEEVFNEGKAQYLHVPRETAKKFYERRWLDTMETSETGEYNSLAEMYLVKFGDHPLDPVWPVDIAVWQKNEAEKILGYLSGDARPGFPIPDFPMCIQKAHEHAKIGGIEMSYINDLLVEEMQKNMNNKDLEKLDRARYLGEDTAARRYPK